MARCRISNDNLAIIEAIEGYEGFGIRLDRVEHDRVASWCATPRFEGLGQGSAKTRSGAVWKYLMDALGDTDHSQVVYGIVREAIIQSFPDEADRVSTRPRHGNEIEIRDSRE